MLLTERKRTGHLGLSCCEYDDHFEALLLHHSAAMVASVLLSSKLFPVELYQECCTPLPLINSQFFGHLFQATGHLVCEIHLGKESWQMNNTVKKTSLSHAFLSLAQLCPETHIITCTINSSKCPIHPSATIISNFWVIVCVSFVFWFRFGVTDFCLFED